MTRSRGWRPVILAVLFITFINDLYDRMSLSCVADNEKLGVADTPEGRAAIWKVLRRQETWVDRNLMKFSNEKCKGFFQRKSTDSFTHTPEQQQTCPKPATLLLHVADTRAVTSRAQSTLCTTLRISCSDLSVLLGGK